MTAAIPNRQPLTAHTVQITSRKQLQITGVTEVCSFHETEIVLKIESGLMVLNGEGLHVGKLVLDEGRLDVTGMIDSIVYEKPKLSAGRLLWRRKAGK